MLTVSGNVHIEYRFRLILVAVMVLLATFGYSESPPSISNETVNLEVIDTNGDIVISRNDLLADAIALNSAKVNISISSHMENQYEPEHSWMAFVFLKDLESYPGPFESFGMPSSKGVWKSVSISGKVNGFIDAKNCLSFSEGLAPACKAVGQFDFWGYVAPNGRWVIEPTFLRAGPFSDGLAPVLVGAQLLGLTPNSSGLDGRFRGGLYGFISMDGSYEITPKYLWAGPFSEGLAPIVRLDSLTEKRINVEFISKEQETAFEIENVEQVMPFSGGLAEVIRIRNGKMVSGFIDIEGNTAIDYVWDDAHFFSDGLAPVEREGKWGYIDDRGELVIPLKFADATVFYKGYAIVAVPK